MQTLKIHIDYSGRPTNVHHTSQFLVALSLIYDGMAADTDPRRAQALEQRVQDADTPIAPIPAWPRPAFDDVSTYLRQLAHKLVKFDQPTWYAETMSRDFLYSQAILLRTASHEAFRLVEYKRGSDTYTLTDQVGTILEFIADLFRRITPKPGPQAISRPGGFFFLPDFLGARESILGRSQPGEGIPLGVAAIGVSFLEMAMPQQTEAVRISVQRD